MKTKHQIIDEFHAVIACGLNRAIDGLEMAEDDGLNVYDNRRAASSALQSIADFVRWAKSELNERERNLTPSTPGWENSDISRLARQSASEGHFQAKADHFVD